MKRILIAGIGNIFFGDDAFGVEVVRELARSSLPPQVEVVDFGIRSYDLACALAEGCDVAVLVDAAPRGEAPGTVYLLELDRRQLSQLPFSDVDAHSLNPVHVIQLAEHFGPGPERLFLVGCEPARTDSPDGQIGLSDPVAAAIPQALAMIGALVLKLLGFQIEETSGLAPV